MQVHVAPGVAQNLRDGVIVSAARVVSSCVLNGARAGARAWRIAAAAGGLGLAACLALPVAAAPVAVDAEVPAPPLPWLGTVVPTDIERWARDEAAQAMLSSAVEHERHAVLLQGWQPRPPTWIQAAAQVNLGDYPSLDDTTAQAERDLETLNWVIQQQQREAAERGVRRGGGGSEGSEDDRWFLRLLPHHWIQFLKANREWVVAGGTTLLLIVWGASLFARRPSAAPPAAAEAAPPPVKRRRRHRRSSRLQWQ